MTRHARTIPGACPPVTAEIDGYAPASELAREPMFYDCAPVDVFRECGPHTLRALHACLAGWSYDVIYRHARVDTRVHMLKQGWIPAIPGWHCDSVPRPDGQPDMDLCDPRQIHRMILLGDTEVSLTEMCMDPVDVSAWGGDGAYWGHVDAAVGAERRNVYRVPHGKVVEFGDDVLHRAAPATGDGWRLFVRVRSSMEPPKGGRRNQVQVYCGTGGW